MRFMVAARVGYGWGPRKGTGGRVQPGEGRSPTGDGDGDSDGDGGGDGVVGCGRAVAALVEV